MFPLLLQIYRICVTSDSGIYPEKSVTVCPLRNFSIMWDLKDMSRGIFAFVNNILFSEDLISVVVVSDIKIIKNPNRFVRERYLEVLETFVNDTSLECVCVCVGIKIFSGNTYSH